MSEKGELAKLSLILELMHEKNVKKIKLGEMEVELFACVKKYEKVEEKKEDEIETHLEKLFRADQDKLNKIEMGMEL